VSKIVVDTFVTLDGVMQAPNGPDDDRDGDFPHGGWQVPHSDEAIDAFIGAGIAQTTGLLLGRRTYEAFAAHWPNVPGESARTLNELPKYVASRTLDTVEWQNSTLLGADVPRAVAELRARPGGEIHVVGSGDLLQTLIRHDLVDVYRLMVFPVLLGTGKRLFGEGTGPAGLTLVETRTTDKGAIICVYQRAGDVTYGSY
jgi:dihydrofolate reductase